MLFSFNKILLLAAVLAAVWYGFKLVGRLDRARKRKLREAARGPSDTRGDPAARERSGTETIDLVRGEDGKTFVARDTDKRV